MTTEDTGAAYDKEAEFVVGPDHTGTGESITMYRHSGAQITGCEPSAA